MERTAWGSPSLLPSLPCPPEMNMSKHGKLLLSDTVDLLESLHPDKLPDLIDLVMAHAEIPSFILREAHKIVMQRRKHK